MNLQDKTGIVDKLKTHPLTRHLWRFVATAVGFAALLWFCGWLVRPDLSAELPQYSPKELEAAAQLRDNSVDPNDLVRIQQEVDYSKGPQAPWYPKGESPILAELVRDGHLPPVAQRVGPEPIVYEGVDGIGTYGGTWVRAIPNASILGFYMRYELGCGSGNGIGRAIATRFAKEGASITVADIEIEEALAALAQTLHFEVKYHRLSLYFM